MKKLIAALMVAASVGCAIEPKTRVSEVNPVILDGTYWVDATVSYDGADLLAFPDRLIVFDQNGTALSAFGVTAEVDEISGKIDNDFQDLYAGVVRTIAFDGELKLGEGVIFVDGDIQDVTEWTAEWRLSNYRAFDPNFPVPPSTQPGAFSGNNQVVLSRDILTAEPARAAKMLRGES